MAGHAVADAQVEHAGRVVRVLDERVAAGIGHRERAPVHVDVAGALAPGAEHVIFGHTHRPGPLERDDVAEWTTLPGTRLWNSGSWLHEGAFVRSGRDSPYWPGTVLTLEDEGPPRLENVLAGARAE